jgi:hypothetical protein
MVFSAKKQMFIVLKQPQLILICYKINGLCLHQSVTLLIARVFHSALAGTV